MCFCDRAVSSFVVIVLWSQKSLQTEFCTIRDWESPGCLCVALSDSCNTELRGSPTDSCFNNHCKDSHAPWVLCRWHLAALEVSDFVLLHRSLKSRTTFIHAVGKWSKDTRTLTSWAVKQCPIRTGFGHLFDWARVEERTRTKRAFQCDNRKVVFFFPYRHLESDLSTKIVEKHPLCHANVCILVNFDIQKPNPSRRQQEAQNPLLHFQWTLLSSWIVSHKEPQHWFSISPKTSHTSIPFFLSLSGTCVSRDGCLRFSVVINGSFVHNTESMDLEFAACNDW